MSGGSNYAVFTTGNLINGFEQDDVTSSFCDLFKVSPTKAEKFITSRKIVKKNLSLEDTKAYQLKLRKIGVDADIGQEVNGKYKKISRQASPSEPTGLSLTPIVGASEASEPTKDVPATEFACPKCKLVQTKSEQCSGCGVFFNKVNSAATATTSSRSTERKLSRDRVAATDDEDSAFDEDKELSINGMKFAIAAAVAGSIVWLIIAQTFNVESTVISCLIGFAIAFAAAETCGTSEKIGIACAVLALLSIFGGKYLDSHFRLSEIRSIVSEYQLDEFELREHYENAIRYANEYEKIEKNDRSYKKYIVEMGFFDNYSVDTISDEEYAWFKTNHIPLLEELVLKKPDFTEWKRDMAPDPGSEFVAITEQSTLQFAKSQLAITDILLIMLGIFIAYQVGRGENIKIFGSRR